MAKELMRRGNSDAWCGTRIPKESRTRTRAPFLSGRAYTRQILTVLTTLALASPFSAQSPQTTPQSRLLMASRIYHVVSTFFPGLSQEKFDADYEQYLGAILRSDDRREFDMASMKLIADLRD